MGHGHALTLKGRLLSFVHNKKLVVYKRLVTSRIYVPVIAFGDKSNIKIGTATLTVPVKLLMHFIDDLHVVLSCCNNKKQKYDISVSFSIFN